MEAQEDAILDIIDNLTRHYLTENGEHYYLLMKKQKDKKYATLYITDHYNQFWIKQVTEEYLLEVRNSLNLAS